MYTVSIVANQMRLKIFTKKDVESGVDFIRKKDSPGKFCPFGPQIQLQGKQFPGDVSNN
jgi:hypothetical protein